MHIRWQLLGPIGQTRACCAAVQGTLKGYDQLLNLVMDETIEYLRGDLIHGTTDRLSILCMTEMCLPTQTLRIHSEYLIRPEI